MSTPGKVARKENLELQCEWGACSFVCWAVEEFCEHITQHLQQHLPASRSGSGEEEEEDLLGKGAGWAESLREGGNLTSFPQREKAAWENVVYFLPVLFFVYITL